MSLQHQSSMHAPLKDPVVKAVDTNLHLVSGKTPLHILKDVNMSIDPGEVVAVVGPSGSGKTSLMMVLGGLEKASSGQVVVGGEDISNADEDQLAMFRRRNLGILFQSFHLIPSMTALENVALALEIAETGMSYGDILKAAEAALNEVGLTDRMDHLPRALSGGEQQRVALARAMVTKPRLMLADEPTGNLDQETGARIIELMFGLARDKGTAILLITHDPNLAAQADRTLTMTRGRLTADPVRTVA